jgi:2,4-dienoyl-CoA reductase (NADPH2)
MITTSMSPGEGYVTWEGRPTQRHLNFLEERAAGGVALMAQTLAAYPREEGWGHPLVYAYREEDIPHLKKMADVVHKHGGLIYGQFQRGVWRRNFDEGELAWGTSAVAVSE